MPSGPRIYVHEGTGQAKACLQGLVDYAQRQAQDPLARRFPTLESYRQWCYALPVVYDLGEGPTVRGCSPAQRSRGWAEAEHKGLNCWEATGLFVAAAIAEQAPIEVHVYDVTVNGQRHVFPGVRDLGEKARPKAVVLQPPVVAQGMLRRGRMQAQGLRGVWGRARAQAWYNDVLGGGHVVGRAVLDVFGGSTGDKGADLLEKVEDQDVPGGLPGWAKKQSAPAPQTLVPVTPQAGPAAPPSAPAPPPVPPTPGTMPMVPSAPPPPPPESGWDGVVYSAPDPTEQDQAAA